MQFHQLAPIRKLNQKNHAYILYRIFYAYMQDYIFRSIDGIFTVHMQEKICTVYLHSFFPIETIAQENSDKTKLFAFFRWLMSSSVSLSCDLLAKR